MRITEKILNALNAVKAAGYVESVLYNSQYKANVQLDGIATPVAVLYLFRDGAYDTATGLLREEAEINVMFLTHQRELDFDGIANEALIDTMSEAATAFIAEVTRTNNIAIVGDNITLRGVYDTYDTNTTGVSMQFRVRELQGQCINSL